MHRAMQSPRLIKLGLNHLGRRLLSAIALWIQQAGYWLCFGLTDLCIGPMDPGHDGGADTADLNDISIQVTEDILVHCRQSIKTLHCDFSYTECMYTNVKHQCVGLAKHTQQAQKFSQW